MPKEEKIRRLAEFKTVLEKKMMETKADLESLETLLEFVNEFLLESGFKRADVESAKPKKESTAKFIPKYKTVVPLKTSTGELLANFYIGKDSLRVTPAKNKTFKIITPPFQQFLVRRVLEKMRGKDKQTVNNGELSINKMLSYELILDDETIQDLVIRNVSAERMRELRSSIHWTFEKMNEKM